MMRITFACAWFSLLSLIAATALDVAIRQIAHVGSDKLSEIEAALFLLLVMLLIAIACVAAFPKVATWLPEQVLTHDAPRKAGGHSKI